MKRIRFWGTRGSLPVALTASAVRQKIVAAAARRLGPHLRVGRRRRALRRRPRVRRGRNLRRKHSPASKSRPAEPEYVICDLGSGVRPFGQAALARHGPRSPQTYHIFMSHVHWDHIMGLPFFAPAYIPGNRIRIYGSHAWLESALRRQQDAPSFPVDFSFLRADIEFVHLEPDRPHAVAGMTVTTMLQRHAGDSYGYRFEANGQSVVYTTDSEHKLDDPMETESYVGVLPQCRRRDLRRDVFARRCHFGPRRLGAFEQRRRRRALPDGGRAASLPVPSRARLQRPGDRCGARRHAAPRGNHADRRAARHHAPRTTAWKSSCEGAGGVRTGRAPDRTHPPRRHRRPRRARRPHRARSRPSRRAANRRGSTRTRCSRRAIRSRCRSPWSRSTRRAWRRSASGHGRAT